MYIKKIKKKNGKTNKTYEYLHLVENIRTEKGPRPKLIINLGSLHIDPSQYTALAKRIQDIITGQQSLIVDKNIEKHAKQAADKIFKKNAKRQEEREEHNFELTDLTSIQAENARSLGAEYVCHSIWNELKLNDFFITNHVPQTTIPIIESLVIGRLIEPGSERFTKTWVENRSALYELTGSPLRYSLNSYYKADDRIISLKDKLETYLARTEKGLFSLNEKYYFFDLTNSYFEGKCLGNAKAKYGRSKEKRSDCKLVTLGLVVDESGFAKCSNLFEGNRNETTTLESMILRLEEKTGHKAIDKTIVMDAGIASEENIRWLQAHHYHYIVVNRGKAPIEINYEDMSIIKEDANKDIKIEVKRYRHEKEVYILCKSRQKQIKEQSMRTRIEQLFIDRLAYYKSGLKKANRMKRYQKVVEGIGRLKEKYSKISQYYSVTVMPEEGKKSDDVTLLAVDIKWEKKEPVHKEKIENEGSYILRSDRIDLPDKEIWDIYIMLRHIEYSFLCMKSYLGLRPNFHQKEERMDAHMFISVLAYHILHIIEYRLRQKGETRKWDTIRDILKTHQRLTVSLRTKNSDGKIINQKLRLNTTAEPEHKYIYNTLNLSKALLPKNLKIDYLVNL